MADVSLIYAHAHNSRDRRWWQRWYFLSRAVGMGYRVLSLDTDISLRASPYPLLHGPLWRHELLTGLDSDQQTSSYYFPQINVGFVYARGPPGGAGHAVLVETQKRLERILEGEIIGHPMVRPGEDSGVMSLWDQDTFKDALETAAFTPNNPSYRHSMIHQLARIKGQAPHRLSSPLPASWVWQKERLRFFGSATQMFPSAWLPLVAHVRESSKNASFGGVPMWLFATYQLCPHGNVCDGRWGWDPPPVIIGHVVGTKAKFWILRMLGWWNYGAASAPSLLPATSSESSEHTLWLTNASDRSTKINDRASKSDGSYRSGSGCRTARDADDKGHRGGDRAGSRRVFPTGHPRMLVLRGSHGLHLPYASSGRSIKSLHKQLVRWSLLALAIGRRAVIPLVPCEIPVPDTPNSLRKASLIIKLSAPTLCNASVQSASWRMKPTAALNVSPMSMHRTREMKAMGDYSKVMRWPPDRASSCCQLIPALRCIDQFGSGDELYQEMLFNERDLGWLESEADRLGEPIRSTILRVGTSTNLTLADLRSKAMAQVLVIDITADGTLESIPTLADIIAAEFDTTRETNSKRRKGTPSRTNARESPSKAERKCVDQLLNSVH